MNTLRISKKVVNKTREALNNTNTIIAALNARLVQLKQARPQHLALLLLLMTVADTELDDDINVRRQPRREAFHRLTA
jgi:hypothetical protein